MYFFTPGSFVQVPLMSHELGKQHQVGLWQMGSGVFNTLQIGIELFANFRVHPLQNTNSLAFEALSTFVRDPMEKVMPKSGATKEGGLPVQGILIQTAGKIIKDLLGGSRLILEKGWENIFSALASLDQVESIHMAMNCTNHDHHVTETRFWNLKEWVRFNWMQLAEKQWNQTFFKCTVTFAYCFLHSPSTSGWSSWVVSTLCAEYLGILRSCCPDSVK